jgi:hypothetical protein
MIRKSEEKEKRKRKRKEKNEKNIFVNELSFYNIRYYSRKTVRHFIFMTKLVRITQKVTYN